MMAFNGGLGVHSMWGFSPSMDLLNHHHNPIEAEACITDTNNHDSSGSPPPPPSLSSAPAPAPAPAPAAALNILLVQPSDARHIIHTIAHRCRRSKESKDDSSSSHPRQINFYILEGEIEVFARLLLQLHIFLDDNIPMRHRAALFLEIYGNILVQGRTEEYIAHTSSMLRELISGQKYEHESMKEIVSLDHLKQRDRDDLDSVFKSWSIDVRYDIAMYRDYRLRGYYGDRFDCRQNLIDWDYFGRVKEVASIIHNKQYQEWRMKGIAFEFGDATYTSPNRTMCTFTKGAVKSGKDCGTLQDFQGFWLDILVGPYIGFGVEINSSDSKRAKQLFDIVNKGSGAEQHRHHTVDVAMYNLLAFMFEIETNTQYEMKLERDIFSGLGQTQSNTSLKRDEAIQEQKKSSCINKKEINVNTGKLTNHEDSDDDDGVNPSSSKDEFIKQSINGIKLIPIKSDLKTIAGKKKYKNLFDQIHLSYQGATLLGESYLKDLCKSHEMQQNRNNAESRNSACKITVETAKFIFPLDKKNHAALNEKIVDLGEKNGLFSVDSSDNRPENDWNVISFQSK